MNTHEAHLHGPIHVSFCQVWLCPTTVSH
ncbi:rCG40799 [Rattus norvegicus]|uniref:RCG40799 n=1 Tax=Rattus norvegicus TaxID=10116 RepID=A6MGQ5_RAT|nr:rCG40799 [Rattus norvegicus]